MGIAFALPALALPPVPAAAQTATRPQASHTALSAETRDVNGRTEATLRVTVTGADGAPATGGVVLLDQGKPIAGVALNAEGQANPVLTLTPGDHALTASYNGDGAHLASVSEASPVAADSGATPDFGITVAPASLTLTQGQSGSVTASITPIDAADLTAPMFVTLSCSGLPDQSSCTFTPENIEILPGATDNIASSMVLATAAQNRASATPPAAASSRVAWALLLPGSLGLAGLAFGARRRRWLQRMALLALVGFLAVLGTTACSPLYYYRNHGPSPNLPTPTGTYTIQVTAQSSNGISATTRHTTMVLTVQ